MNFFTKIFLFLSVFWLFSIFEPNNKIFAQSTSQIKIDSLLQLLPNVADTLQVKICRDLSILYQRKNFKEAYHYARLSRQKAEKTQNYKLIGNSLDYLGSLYVQQGEFVEGLTYKLQALKLFEEKNYRSGLVSLHNNVGYTYYRQNDLIKALHHYRKALEIAENEKVKMEEETATYLLNIGEVLADMKLYDEAIIHEEKAIKISEKFNVVDNLGYCNGILGKIHRAKNNYPLAIQYLQKAIDIFKKLDQPDDMSEYLLHLARTYILQKDFQKARSTAQNALKTAEIAQAKEWIKESRNTLADIYTQLGDSPKALFYLRKYLSLKDSMMNEAVMKQSNNMHILYESEKKEAEIEILKDKSEIQQANIQNRNFWLFGSFIFLILISALLALYFYKNQEKAKANFILTQQKNEIEAQNKKIETQRDNLIQLNEEINQRNEEILSQRDAMAIQSKEIEDKNRDITSSIAYAERIQYALLPFEENIKTLFPQNFIIFQPRDIVSGDFYWIQEKEGKKIIVAIDCTGHGVPGAFMTMIADSVLNQIVLDKNITEADEILNQMHITIRNTLQQEHNLNRDGMDISLVVIDEKNHTLTFAGAHNPLVVFQHNQRTIIKGDMLAIGGFQMEHTRRFTAHTIDIHTPTTFYLFTDGFSDQFGGNEKKKFMIRRLYNTLSEIHHLALSTQKETLMQIFNDWKGDQKQIDDVLVMGFKIG